MKKFNFSTGNKRSRQSKIITCIWSSAVLLFILPVVCSATQITSGDTITLSATANDEDTHYDSEMDKTCVNDNVTVTWSAPAGSFPNGNTGSSVQWTAPVVTISTNVVITATADDTGTKYDDSSNSDSTTVTVLPLLSDCEYDTDCPCGFCSDISHKCVSLCLLMDCQECIDGVCTDKCKPEQCQVCNGSGACETTCSTGWSCCGEPYKCCPPGEECCNGECVSECVPNSENTDCESGIPNIPCAAFCSDGDRLCPFIVWKTDYAGGGQNTGCTGGCEGDCQHNVEKLCSTDYRCDQMEVLFVNCPHEPFVGCDGTSLTSCYHCVEDSESVVKNFISNWGCK